ncbi:MAG TPA: arylesterase [Alphaproteobacteria bacterium]|nr:arylesterase [Alphaproteobacteria bacterium]
MIAVMLPRAAFGQTSGRLVVLGDSLAAGYGLPSEEAFPARLQSALAAAGHTVEVINAGVSGDTTAGGLARLDWALGNPAPGFAIVELGANDALRGLDPARAYENLDRIIARLKQRSVKVLLAGMKAPRNLGRDYANAFDAIYPRLAEKHRVALYDFFLDGVAAIPALNQRDGIHPNARGVEIIVERILPHVTRLLDGR